MKSQNQRRSVLMLLPESIFFLVGCFFLGFIYFFGILMVNFITFQSIYTGKFLP